MTEKKVLWKNIDINLFFFHLSEFFNWFKCLSFKVHELHPSFFSFTSLFFSNKIIHLWLFTNILTYKTQIKQDYFFIVGDKIDLQNFSVRNDSTVWYGDFPLYTWRF